VVTVYAKSHPPETLKEHIERLRSNCELLKKHYGDLIIEEVPNKYQNIFWKLLEITIKAHDLGKIYTPFQNRIRKSLKEPLLAQNKDLDKDIPHNLLSPAFLKEMTESYSDEIALTLYQTIAYHHYRESLVEYLISSDGWDKVKEAIREDLAKNLDRLEDLQDLGIKNAQLSERYRLKIDQADNSRWQRILIANPQIRTLYILLKGFLHRLDYSSSAHLEIEEPPISGKEVQTVSYLVAKGVNEDQIWQKRATACQDNNIILIGSTGIGKTEFAYIWAGDDKVFYTLPVRTSVNAMFERTKSTFSKHNDKIGLLHSDSVFYQLQDEEETIEETLFNVDMSRQLSLPVIVSTADQVFTAALKYPGYERIYATLAYSKVIVDELQSYDPEIAAIILKGLVEITKLGGKFCLMTATLPPFYREKLRSLVPNLVLEERLFKLAKHKIELRDTSIDEAIADIEAMYEKYSKVLVVVNTVKKARQIYEDSAWKHKDSIMLLHAGFTFGDRHEKENRVLDKEHKFEGILISTQLVEASLDIDFPVLFTELASVDSLIQRMGRVLREVKQEGFKYEGFPNVFICTEASGIGSIYYEDIVNNTLNALNELKRGDSLLLSEEEKQRWIEDVFKDQRSKYYLKFQRSWNLLDKGLEAEDKNDAQHIFRRIFNLTAIPLGVFTRHETEIKQALNGVKTGRSKVEIIKNLAKIRNFTVSVPAYKLKQFSIMSQIYKDIYLIDSDYSADIGLLKVDNFLE
jgi:CRISPR-associated endonuclease/helicase Cas3